VDVDALVEEGAVEGGADAGARGEVDDHVGGVAGDVAGELLVVGDVSLDEAVAGVLEVRGDVGALLGGVVGVAKIVEAEDVVTASEQAIDEVRADKPGAAGDQGALH
jgi:hypothetical protein